MRLAGRLRPGQKITLFERDGIITAIPDLPLEKFRGILKGMSRTELREKQERIFDDIEQIRKRVKRRKGVTVRSLIEEGRILYHWEWGQLRPVLSQCGQHHS